MHTYCRQKEAEYALEHYTLHPSLIDGALQSLFGITDGREEASVYVPFSIGEITIRKKFQQNAGFMRVKQAKKVNPSLFTIFSRLMNKEKDLQV
ncbi:polyketide synthase dehydratase domain-containing protein [Bacillus velezensis]|nr:polyketide synthase dehydratase domain-containing protein [Bacillus velezensis]